MSRRRRIGGLGVISATFVAAAAPVTISVDGVRPQAAECQDGTCCPEEKATCVVGNTQVGGYFFKEKGSCTGVS